MYSRGLRAEQAASSYPNLDRFKCAMEPRIKDISGREDVDSDAEYESEYESEDEVSCFEFLFDCAHSPFAQGLFESLRLTERLRSLNIYGRAAVVKAG